ncbi:MAG: FAD-dependent oxidoreductase [Planctomycetota bacterium]
MPKLIIDNQNVEVPEGATILDAARKLGIEIPTLCCRDGQKPNTTCMVCLVRLTGSGKLIPSCAAPAVDGMVIESETEEVHEARKTALELLLSDHLGDCQAPCHGICPAGMNIPLMIRQIQRRQLAEAIRTVKADIAIPAVLGRICPEICERGCRRGQDDKPVSICLLKRYVADVDLASGDPYTPPVGVQSSRSVAIVGAGPAGLAAAYYLRQFGHSVTIFDDHDQPGGALRYGIEREKLPIDVLEAEIATLERLGWKFRGNTRIDSAGALDQLADEFDAVFLGVGEMAEAAARSLGLEHTGRGLQVDRQTLQTSRPGVWAGGDAVRPNRKAVMAAGDGKTAAVAIDQCLRGVEITGRPKRFSVHIGRLAEGEAAEFSAEAADAPRQELDSKTGPGFTDDQARLEAARCLHCDCRKPQSCRLRQLAEQMGASAARLGQDRRRFIQAREGRLIHERGKCISCGICIQVAGEHGEQLGLTFTGRGYSSGVGAGFGRPMLDGLANSADQAVAACPTGALAWQDMEEASADS